MPERNVTLRSCLDPADVVDWDALATDVSWQPSGICHRPYFDGPKLDYYTGDGGIGQTCYSIDGPACALKLFTMVMTTLAVGLNVIVMIARDLDALALTAFGGCPYAKDAKL